MIDKLEMFLVLAREEHFGRAADAFGVSQPTLSSAIKQLEDQLGVMLVARGSRYRGLTPEGQRVHEWAVRIVADARAMRDEMRAAREGLSGILRLAVIPTALPFAARLSARFAARHPNVRLTVLSRNSADILTMLDRYEADAGLTYVGAEPLGRVACLPLFAERYALVVPRGSDLGAREALDWADLRGVALGLLTPDMQNRRLISQHLSEAGIDTPPNVESNSMLFLLARVQAGDCAAILPLDMARSMGTGAGLHAIPITTPAAEHRVGLITPLSAEASPVVSALIQAGTEAAEV